MAKNTNVPYLKGPERGMRTIAVCLLRVTPEEQFKIRDTALRNGVSPAQWILRTVLRALDAEFVTDKKSEK